jgi:hypothetical protein
MLGSYGPSPQGEAYTKNFDPEESPSGMLARSGSYNVRSRVVDDDGEVYAGMLLPYQTASSCSRTVQTGSGPSSLRRSGEARGQEWLSRDWLCWLQVMYAARGFMETRCPRSALFIVRAVDTSIEAASRLSKGNQWLTLRHTTANAPSLPLPYSP